MARYRIGDRYLSESEYNEEQDGNWIFGLFIVGAIAVGILINRYVVDPDWHTAIRFLVTVVPAVLAGGVLAAIHRWIRLLLGIVVGLLVLGVVISVIVAMV
ncbi:hypothetical protein RRM51_004195 [Aeromonas veronii]|nr:hypothetical protein [Aeromonas veronii]